MARYTIESLASGRLSATCKPALREVRAPVQICTEREREEPGLSHALAPRNTRSSQPSSPSQVLKTESRSGLNSPKSSTKAFKQPLAASPPSSLFSTPKAHNAQSASHSTLPKSSVMTLQSTNSFANLSLHSRKSSNDITQVVTQVSKPERRENQYKEHLFTTFQALKFVKGLPPADFQEIAQKTIWLPATTRKTVIFDLDETLVHCVQDPNQAEAAIPVTFPTGETVIVGLNVRPYARECLAAVSSCCEVVVFTASQQCYADRVLDFLDPEGRYVSLRLYRQHCIVSQGVHIKDLRILGNRRLEDITIVDNAAYSFAYQLDNGVPIVSWYDDTSDRELRNLVEYLRRSTVEPDVRVLHRQTFRLETFYEQYYREFIRPSIFE